jgi:hypothetical protein
VETTTLIVVLNRNTLIADLRRHNIFVDFLPGDFENETVREASMWKSPALRTLLARGPAFKMVPAPSTSTETLIAQRRAAVSAITSIRREIRARSSEDPSALSQNIPKDVGFGAIKHTRNPGVWRRVDQGFHQNLRLRSASDWALGRAWRSAEAPRRRIARRGGTYLEGVSDGGTETPCDVIASFEGDAKAVGGDPRGASVLRVLRGAGALQDFPTLLHFAQPLLFAEGIRLVLLIVEVLQDSSSFLQLAPPLHSPATQFEPLYARRLKVSNGTNAACAKE